MSCLLQAKGKGVFKPILQGKLPCQCATTFTRHSLPPPPQYITEQGGMLRQSLNKRDKSERRDGVSPSLSCLSICCCQEEKYKDLGAIQTAL